MNNNLRKALILLVLFVASCVPAQATQTPAPKATPKFRGSYEVRELGKFPPMEQWKVIPQAENQKVFADAFWGITIKTTLTGYQSNNVVISVDITVGADTLRIDAQCKLIQTIPSIWSVDMLIETYLYQTTMPGAFALNIRPNQNEYIRTVTIGCFDGIWRFIVE